jgi:hypothetical protein
MNNHDDINETIEKMKPLLLKAGIKVERKLFLAPLRRKVPDTCAEEANAWLTDVFVKEYRAALKVRQLVTEKMWDSYDIFPEDFADHQEVLLWTAAAKVLREKVNSAMRPDYFKKAAIDRLIKKYSND